MKIADLGEFSLIEVIKQTVDESGAGIDSKPDLIIGIGDDAAVWQSNSSTQIGTTDTLVQDIHFDLNITSWHDLGWKALAVNISDIAAMGGIPSYAMISLGLPSDTEVEQVIELYKGMAQIASKLGMGIAGGDISESSLLTITATIIGNVEKDKILLRSGAIAGNLIAVTGYLGASASGLKLLQGQVKLGSEISAILSESHLRPWPRVAEGQIMAECGVKSAIDISDGLIADLTHICQSSEVGAKVHVKDIPIHTATSIAFPKEATEFALTGGEDYELLFTSSNDAITEIRKYITTPVTIIGEIVSEKPGIVTLIGEDGKEIDFNKGGWEHFGNHS
ncbi:MAG: thiamine-phosphate kinase [Chloroflexi bacterium]|nr:thiamine-phosphate kinase [Chloroflexota bacterium]